MFSFVWQSLSMPSNNSIKYFTVQFFTWSNLSDKLISFICSCNHLFCSCPSCFSLDCFSSRPAYKAVILELPLADILGISFTFVEPFSPGSYAYLSIYSFILVSSTITVERVQGKYIWGILFLSSYLTVFWLMRDFCTGNNFPSKVWRGSLIAWLLLWMLWNLMWKFTFCSSLGDFTSLVEVNNFSYPKKKVYSCIVASCSYFMGAASFVISSRVLIIDPLTCSSVPCMF